MDLLKLDQMLSVKAVKPIGLHHPLDGVTNPEYKLFCFIQLTKFFCKEKKALALIRTGAAI
jgi:hypothetical protein